MFARARVPFTITKANLNIRNNSIRRFPGLRNMATASKVHLEASQKPQFHVEGLTSESAEKTSRLLQTNHEQHHIFFNNDGFHNHIAHHLLTLFALNATPEELQKAYDNNVTYQRPAEPLKKTIVNDMHDPSRFATYLGKEKYYHDFLVYFQGEIEKKGWQATLQEYVFSGTEQADDMLVRMFAGFLHPIIHLGFGIEFQQPAIIAEALAQAAVHDEWMKSLFFGCEKAASQRRGEKNTTSIVEILEQCRQDEKLKGSAKFNDANKIRDGILKRAPEEMIEYATRYRVSEEELEKKTAEMIDASVFFTASSQHPPHQIKFDFFYMHCVTSSIFFSAFLSPSSSLPASAQRRLLEWKVWNDITMYVSRGSPALLIDEIKNYKSTRDASIQDVIQRVRKIEDDGHASKLVRALANGAQVCRKWEADEDTMKIRGDMWRVIANMAIDSVEAGEPQWVRSCGFDEAWEKVPVRGEGGTSESGSRL